MLRALAWLMLLFVGQWAQLPQGVALPRAASQLVADAGAHVPVVQSKPVAVAARLEVRAEPPQNPDLPVLVLAASCPAFHAEPALPVADPSGRRVVVEKGFWACGPPARLQSA